MTRFKLDQGALDVMIADRVSVHKYLDEGVLLVLEMEDTGKVQRMIISLHPEDVSALVADIFNLSGVMPEPGTSEPNQPEDDMDPNYDFVIRKPHDAAKRLTQLTEAHNEVKQLIRTYLAAENKVREAWMTADGDNWTRAYTERDAAVERMRDFEKKLLEAGK